ncbi:MAG TPA: DUF1553 domain-containing protein [Chthonomonadaceae bacterium]|nr:DUF1553 domain-containing protein [Chthonomonadaceae bacterium]
MNRLAPKSSRKPQDQTASRPLLATCCGALALLAATALAAGASDPAAAPPKSKSAPTPDAKPISFNRDIRPILTENCFTCHGPDSARRAANLRLDDRADAVAKGVIVAGAPDRSRLIARILGQGGQPIMPPVASGKRLTQDQKALLRRWIASGAKYDVHWSLTPLPARMELPAVKSPDWCGGAIDRFVLARLEREGVRPSKAAAKAELLRRVTFDLTGLPPTPAEAGAFLADNSPAAYDAVVDRLLASPRFGERMATPWLDIARYADSYGYQSDQLCPTWPYRDWVVKAFNENLPYDKFLTQQIAGDLLSNATRDQRLATAFNRLHRMTNEGGSVAEEWRLEGVADRVRTFGTAFLGLTLECARCHDHKFDPITQKDYYSFSSFLNSIDEYGLYDRADIVPSPTILLPTAGQEQQLAAARDGAARAEAALNAIQTGRDAEFRAWLTDAVRAAARGGLFKPDVIGAGPPLQDMTGRFDFTAFEGATLKNRVVGATQNGERSDEVPIVDAPFGKAVKLDGENNIHFAELGRFTRHTPFTIAFRMRDPREVEGAAVVFQACDGTDVGPHGYDLTVDQGVLTARIFRHWPGNAIGVRTKLALPKDTWTHVAVSYDGSSRAEGLKIFVDGKPAELDILRDHLVKGVGQHTLVFGQRFRDRGFKGGEIGDLAIFSRDIQPAEIAELAYPNTLEQMLAHPEMHEAALKACYLSAVDPASREAARKLADARASVWRAEDAQTEVAVMEEMPEPRPTFVLVRGRYDAPTGDTNRVGRSTPASLPPFPAGAPQNRLGLAQWLTQPDHPLTARVEVNRIWALLFGKGLVETTEDFGIQGRPPTHPELLDWLARDFVQSGWDVKALIRKIVRSTTYRQASALRPDLRDRDPNNALLARGPSHRLTAEEIRDLALAASGLLDGRIGGPPVSPYQPGDLWRESNSMSPAYRQSVGGDLYRRSLYTVWKRTAPMPNMTAFDVGSREVCTARRQPTNTPLQALVLLNDPQFVEAARVIGARAIKEGGATPEARARWVFRLLATREPTATEIAALATLYRDQLDQFGKDAAGAQKLIHVGASRPDATAPPAELAAATMLAQTVLNLDATIWER